MNDIIAYKSKLDKTFNVYILFPDDGDVYTVMKAQYPGKSVAYTDLRKKDIYIDGAQLKDLNKNHLNFVESHEISHQRLKHIAAKSNKHQEAEADYGAYLLLRQHNLNDAAKIVKTQWQLRHGGSFKKYQRIHHDNLSKRMNIFGVDLPVAENVRKEWREMLKNEVKEITRNNNL